MPRRYRIFRTPLSFILHIRYKIKHTEEDREFWSIQTPFDTFHGLESEKQCKEIAKQLDL